LYALAEPGSVHDYGIGANPAVVAYHHISVNGGKGFNFYIVPDFGIGVDIG
jgi:hypothetical protein